MSVKDVVRTKSISVCVGDFELKELLTPFVGVRDSYDSFKLFRGIAYTDKLDRDGEIATHDYLEQLASKLVGVPVIKNHDWSDVDGIVGRVVKAEVEKDGDTEFIRILFYAVKPEDIENIENGLYFGLSVGSCARSEDNKLVECTDAYEVSLVVVQAVTGAHITKSKKEVTDSMELENLKAENEALKSELEAIKVENDELKTKLAEIEEQEFKNEAEDLLEDKAVEEADKMEPTNDIVKGFIVDELKSAGYELDSSEDAVTLKCGKSINFKQFNAKIEDVKTKYAQLGLLGKKEETHVDTKIETKSKKLDFSAGDVSKKTANYNNAKRGMSVKFD